MKSIKSALIALAASLLVVACTKDPVIPDAPLVDDAARAYVLNEGLWGSNDGSLSLLDHSNGNVENYYFANRNGRGLGDVAQDVAAYGAKLYIVVYGSSTLEVCRAKDASSIQQISFAGRSPRFVVFHGDKAYVSCYNKYIYQIDTATLSITDSCLLSGMQPEELCVVGSKICVANGWARDNGGTIIYDNTLSVVDLNTFTEEKKISVGLNPARVAAIDDSHVLLSYWGDYANAASGLQIIDLATEAVEDLGLECTSFDIYQGHIYSFSFSYTTGQTLFTRTNIATREKTPILSNCGIKFKSVYGISINPANGDILVTDSQQFRSNGDVHCFAPDGTRRWSAEVGKGPSKVIFI